MDQGNAQLKGAVTVLESYIPNDVVGEEHRAHGKLQLWICITGALATTTLTAGAKLVQESANYSRRRTYYGY